MVGAVRLEVQANSITRVKLLDRFVSNKQQHYSYILIIFCILIGTYES